MKNKLNKARYIILVIGIVVILLTVISAIVLKSKDNLKLPALNRCTWKSFSGACKMIGSCTTGFDVVSTCDAGKTCCLIKPYENFVIIDDKPVDVGNIKVKHVIDKTTGEWKYNTTNGNFSRTPTSVVIHDTLDCCVDQALKTLAIRGLGSHFVLDGDGTLYQICDLNTKGQHTTSGYNSKSIGIEVVNPLLFDRTCDSSTTKRACSWDEAPYWAVRQKRPKQSWCGPTSSGRTPQDGYYDLTTPQVCALKSIVTFLCDYYSIPYDTYRNSDGTVFYRNFFSGTVPTGLQNGAFNGVVSHGQTQLDRWDGNAGLKWLFDPIDKDPCFFAPSLPSSVSSDIPGFIPAWKR